MSAAAPRFGQLTYTSFDSGQRGGWQVKQTTGELTPAEIDYLTSQIVTRIDIPMSLPPYPSLDQIARLPSRLVYGPTPWGGRAYWHTCPSGVDGSGRPANVFAHVVLDREPGTTTSSLRPTDLWSSPYWLRPFGPLQVTDADLDAVPDLPWPDHVLTRSQVVDFALRAAVSRFGVLAPLMDAVAAALRGGPPVVLAAQSTDSAALWIASLCYLMSPATSRMLCWALPERAAGLEALWQKNIRLAAVPIDDIGQIDRHQVCVIDETVPLTLGALGGQPHVSDQGGSVAVTPWSALTQVVLDGPELAARTLAIQDDLASELRDEKLAPVWPMAWAVTLDPELAEDAGDDALLALRTDVPPGLRSSERLDPLWRSLFVDRFLGATVRDAWDHIAVAAGDGLAAPYELAVTVYLERALVSQDWLLQGETVPVPDQVPGHRDPGLRVRASRELAAVEGRLTAGQDRIRDATVALRLLDFVLRADLLDLDGETQPQSVEAAYRLCGRVARDVLLDPSVSAATVAAVGDLSIQTMAEFVRPQVKELLPRARAPRGRRLPVEVWTWLQRGVNLTLPSVKALAKGVMRLDPLLSELAAQVTAVHPDPSALRLYELWAALEEQGVDAPADPAIGRLAAGPAFGASDLREILEKFDPRLLAPFLRPTLTAGPSGTEMDELVHAVLSRQSPLMTARAGVEPGSGAAVLRVAHLRFVAANWWQGRFIESVPADVAYLGAAAEDALGGQVPPLASDVLPRIGAAYVADALWQPDGGPPRPRVEQWLRDALPTLCYDVAMVLDRAVEHGVLTDDDLVRAALYGTPTADDVPLGTARMRNLNDLVVRLPEGDFSLIELVVRQRIRSGRLSDVLETWNRVRDRVRSDVEGVVRGGRDAHRLVSHYDRLAEDWWAWVGYSD